MNWIANFAIAIFVLASVEPLAAQSDDPFGNEPDRTQKSVDSKAGETIEELASRLDPFSDSKVTDPAKVIENLIETKRARVAHLEAAFDRVRIMYFADYSADLASAESSRQMAALTSLLAWKDADLPVSPPPSVLATDLRILELAGSPDSTLRSLSIQVLKKNFPETAIRSGYQRGAKRWLPVEYGADSDEARNKREFENEWDYRLFGSEVEATLQDLFDELRFVLENEDLVMVIDSAVDMNRKLPIPDNLKLDGLLHQILPESGLAYIWEGPSMRVLPIGDPRTKVSFHYNVTECLNEQRTIDQLVAEIVGNQIPELTVQAVSRDRLKVTAKITEHLKLSRLLAQLY